MTTDNTTEPRRDSDTVYELVRRLEDGDSAMDACDDAIAMLRAQAAEIIKLRTVIWAIANTAQLCPDRCMADICNDNFLVHLVPLRADMTENEESPISIESNTSLTVGGTPYRAGACSAPDSEGKA